jgi:hypothetical protein
MRHNSQAPPPLAETVAGRRLQRRILVWHAKALAGLMRAGVCTPALAADLSRLSDDALREGLRKIEPQPPTHRLAPRR